MAHGGATARRREERRRRKLASEAYEWFILRPLSPRPVATSKGIRTVTPDELRILGQALGCETQADLAAELGVTQSRISQILTGRYPVRPGTLLNLIRRLQAQTLDTQSLGADQHTSTARLVRARDGNDDA